ncbi:AAA family ATPase [Methylobacterium aquaticum]|uniref:AAA family ATPase n=1 Tax=Methylobacterium aquaticum TaxID=270351 RepID=UPI003D17C19A
MNDTDTDFASLMVPVVEKVLGQPVQRNGTGTDIRWGANLAVSVNATTGQWFCHVAEVGGGVLEFLRVKQNMSTGEALDWLRDEGFLPPREACSPSGGKRLAATFDYVDEDGELLFQVLRYEPKAFRQRRPDPSAQDGWSWKVSGTRSVPYRLTEVLEAVAQRQVVFVAEGEKCVEALRRIGVVATCNAGGAGRWRPEFAEHFHGAHIVILPDNDEPGRKHRDQVASMLAGATGSVRVLELPGLPVKGDAVDWIAAGGTVEELWRLVDEAATSPSDATPAAPSAEVSDEALLLGFVFDGDAPAEPPRYLVKNMLPAEGVTILGGQSGAGKTFIAVDLATSLATGEPFFGRRVVERVGTVILAAEGAGTMEGRVTAARMELTDEACLPITWLGAVGNLANPAEVAALQPRIQAAERRFRERFGVRLGLIVIDTLAAAFALKDENDAAEAQAALRNMRMLGDALGAVVLPVHHYGKTEDTGLRGSSAFRGGADAVLSVLAERNQVTGDVGRRSLNLAKTRFGQEGPIAGFELRFVQLGADADGDPFGACIVVPELDTPAPVRVPPQRDGLGIVALKAAFDEVVTEHGQEVPEYGNGAMVTAVTVKDLRAEFRRRYTTAETDEVKIGNTVRQALKRALTNCPKHGLRTGSWRNEEWLWRVRR